MKEKFNLKSIIASLIILIIGLFLSLMDVFVWESTSSIFLNIGCSFIASSLVGLITSLLVERQNVNPIEEWKLSNIFTARAEINSECAVELRKAKKQVDIVAFGLHSFRHKQETEIENHLKRGINFRILTMNPDSEFVKIREKEEDDYNIKNSIERLVEWANQLNDKKYKGKIVVKGYNCMTLDFYWRVDKVIYIGPYWWRYGSQQTITYKFEQGGVGFKMYSEYFKKLWDDKVLSLPLTSVSRVSSKIR